MTDFTWTQKNSSCVCFLPENAQAEIAWNEIAIQNGGHMNFFNSQKNVVIQQLKAAGYTVSKAKPSKYTLEDIFKQIEELGI